MTAQLAGHHTEVKYYYSDGCWFDGPADLPYGARAGELEDGVAAILVNKV
jgi:hypothetical protein